MKGRIQKLTGGFYYVICPDGLYECRARGILRKKGLSPLVGDIAEIEPVDTKLKMGRLIDVIERKNSIIRPPLANIDQLLLVCSVKEPITSLTIVDRMTVIAEHKGIEPVIVVTKRDLDEDGALALSEIYIKAGFPVFCVNSVTGEGVGELRSFLKEGLCALAGNTGAGKSSLINALKPEYSLETGEISRKLGRGRHTTRTVELLPFGENAFLADTPGFSSVELLKMEVIKKGDLVNCFPDFAPYIDDCRYSSCTHLCETGCSLLKAIDDGLVEKSRHQSYVLMYEEAKNLNEWELDSPK